MTLEEFVAKSNLLSQSELERTRLLSYFYLRTANIQEFTVWKVGRWNQDISLPSPNTTRLRGAMADSSSFIRGSVQGAFRLHAKEVASLDALYPDLAPTSEEVVDRGEVIPQTLYKDFPGYLEKLCREINASYENRIYDGAAVLMRRIIEVMLVLSYRKLAIEAAIKDAKGDYLMLEGIITDAKGNAQLSLSRNTKTHLDEYRKLGNFSAHRIEYNCTKPDLDRVVLEYRATFQELSYKAGLRT